MGDPSVESEAADDLDEAIREEIRTRLRAPSDEKAEAHEDRLVATNALNTAALRLISGCG